MKEQGVEFGRLLKNRERLAASSGSRVTRCRLPADGCQLVELPADCSEAHRPYPFFFSNSFMNDTRASTPSSGNAL
jgi:hypothetical protein